MLASDIIQYFHVRALTVNLTQSVLSPNESSAEYFRTAGKSLNGVTLPWMTAKRPLLLLFLQVKKQLYNATQGRKGRRIQVMLMCSNAAPQPAPASTLPRVRFPVLASFCDACYRGQWSWVHVLRRSRVLSVSQFAAESNKDTGNQHLHLRDHCFLLLQVIHALKKGLQAEGVEEVNCDQLFGLAVSVPDSSSPPVFVLLPEDRAALCEEGGGSTLCQATRSTLLHLLQVETSDDLHTCIVNGSGLLEPVCHTFRAITTALSEEKASSLTQ
ncbi:hypothetical protein JTE90_025600, partial [Oedothorax gibbosus]